VHANNIITLLDAEHAAIGLIAAGAPLSAGLDKILLAAAAQSDDAMSACILLLDEADRFSSVIGPGLAPEYQLALLSCQTGLRTSPFGTAAFSGSPVFSGDIVQDQAWTQGRKDALVQGFRACWAAPVFGARGHILGVLGLLFHVSKHPTQTETDLMQVTARSCAHAIERDLAGKSLLESEDHFRHAHELNAHTLWTAQADGRVDYVARRWREWTGASGLGGGAAAAVHPDDLARTRAAWRQALASGLAYDIEHRIRLRDGQFHWMRSRAMARRDERGVLLKWYGSTEDIEALWQARAALRDSESEFRSLADAMPNQAWLARQDGALYCVNQRVDDYIGADALTNGGWARAIHPDDLARARAAWARAIVAGAAYEIELRLRRADAVYRHFLVRAVPVRGENGATVRWVGTNTDVQEQKNALDKLAYLNFSLEIEVANRGADRDRMWQLSTDIMLVADFGGMIISVNPAWTGILARPEGEALGMDFLQLVHPDDRACTVRQFARLDEGVATLRFENRYRHRDGGYRWLSWTAAGSDGLIHAIGRDISDEKEARLALALSEQALLQSQKLESIGKLTGGVAHDFNNVLQIISANLQLLQLTVSASPAAMSRVETAIAAVERGAKLSSQLLAFARRQPLKPLVTDLGRLVRSTAELFQRAIGETITTEIRVGAGLWHALIDPNQMENVLLNLALNARDAMQGRGRLSVELDNVTLDAQQIDLAAGDYVRLAVTDTGHGMEQDVIDKIFEPFFSTKREGEGTGLGLSMAYGFIKQSGGHIKVSSEAGRGATFEVFLPRTQERLADLRVGLSGPVLGGNETILVVEDDPHVQTAVVDMLHGLGYAVLKANSAEGALTVIKSGQAIDLLLTDVVMPGELRSPELVRLAKILLPDMAVLFTSGYTQNAIMQGGRLDPGVELLSKPYRREDLARKVRQLLTSRSSSGASVAQQQR